MGLRNGVKCGRCDRPYSVLRSRCPYCGASRGKGSKRVSNSDNSVWTLIVGLLILLVLVAAVIVLLVTTLSADKGEKSKDKDKTKVEEKYEEGDGVTDITDPNEPDSTDPADPVDDPVENEPTPVPEDPIDQVVTTLKMKAFGGELSKCSEPDADYDISMKVRDKLDITYEAVPAPENPDIKWTSDNEDVVMVLQSGQVTAVGTGTTNVTLTVNGTSKVCKIRVN